MYTESRVYIYIDIYKFERAFDLFFLLLLRETPAGFHIYIDRCGLEAAQPRTLAANFIRDFSLFSLCLETKCLSEAKE